MNIGYDGYFISDAKNKGGWALTQLELIKQLVAIDTKDEFFVFTDEGGLKLLPNANNIHPLIVNRRGDNFLSRIGAIKNAFENYRVRLDIYIETVEIAPKFPKNVKIFDFVHDFSQGKVEPFLSISRIKGLIYNKYKISTIKRSSVIFCNSNFTKSQLLPLKSDVKVVVYPHGVDYIFKNKKTNPVNLDIDLPQKFFLYIGRINARHKNFKLLLNAFKTYNKKHPEIKLVIATAANYAVEPDSNVILLKSLPIEDIAYLYSKALAFIFPSTYEGFGIPIIEAQCMGCPLILNDIPVFREVSGDCALFFNNTIDDLIIKMEEILNDSVRQKLIECGLKNCERYSWEKTAEIIYNVIHGGKGSDNLSSPP